MGITATITHKTATTTRFALGADGRITIADQTTGERAETYDHAALSAAARSCPEGSEGQEMFSARAASLAALETAEPSPNIPGAPGFTVKPGGP